MKNILVELCSTNDSENDSKTKELLEKINSAIYPDGKITSSSAPSFDGKMTSSFDIKMTSSSEHCGILQLAESDPDVAKRFVGWLFLRRYRWTEQMNEMSLSMSQKTPYQQQVACEIDKIVLWLESHGFLSFYLLLGYKEALNMSGDSPVTRKHILLSVFHWLKNLSNKHLLVVNKCYTPLLEIVLHGITDVWSAIRKDVSTRLHLVSKIVSVPHFKLLIESLINICTKGRCDWQTKTSWQATDGAIKGIERILYSCEWMTSYNRGETKLMIKVGKHTFDSLPEFLREELEGVLFSLFTNNQLSVRETAGKAFATLLNKCDFQHLLESFDKVVKLLNECMEKENEVNNPYEAEGLMSVLLFLIKNIPVGNLLKEWHTYWLVFSYYLSHSASTVRQTASQLFRLLVSVSKELSTPHFAIILLQNLCSPWKSDLQIVTQPPSSSASKKTSRNDWEWREGRLFAYELLLKTLINNHTYYTSHPSSSHHHTHRSLKLSASVTESSLKKAYNLSSSISAPRQRKLTKSYTVCGGLHEAMALQGAKNMTKEQSLLMMVTSQENDFTLLEESIDEVTFTCLPTDENEMGEKACLKWLREQKCAGFNTVLKQMLLQCTECLADAQWELRRMAQQVIPVISDVIFVTYPSLFDELFRCSVPDSPLYLTTCLCLLQTVRKLSKLRKSENKALDLTFDNNLCERIAKNLTILTNQDTIAASISFLLIYSTLNAKVDDCIHTSLCNYLVSLNKEKCDNTQKSTESKKVIETVCSCQDNLIEYCTITPFSFTIGLVPVLLTAVLLLKNEPLDVLTLLNSCEKIMNNLNNSSENILNDEKNEIKANEILSQSADLLLSLIHKFVAGEISLLQVTFRLVYLLHDIMKHTFPLDTLTSALQNTLTAVDSGVVENMTSFESQPSPGDMICFPASSEESSENESDVTDESDWDWSSDKGHTESSTKEVLTEFLDELNSRAIKHRNSLKYL